MGLVGLGCEVRISGFGSGAGHGYVGSRSRILDAEVAGRGVTDLQGEWWFCRGWITNCLLKVQTQLGSLRSIPLRA